MRWLVQTSAFTRGQLLSTMRQPRLLATLVLGPFLVLFVFGLGYTDELPPLRTVLVAGDPEVTQQVEEYLSTSDDEELEGLDFLEVVDTREAGTDMLVAGDADIVVELPDAAIDTVTEGGERATIQVFQQSLDPVSAFEVRVVSEAAVNRINDRVVEEFVRTAQSDTAGYEEDIEASRSAIDAARSAIDAGDAAGYREEADPLRTQLGTLADRLEGTENEAARGQLEDAAEGISSDDPEEAREGLDEAEAALDDVEEVTDTLRDVRPDVVVRPFALEVFSQTPIRITLDRFYAPGVVALMLQHIATTFAALAVVRERQQGLTQLLRVTPVRTGQRLLGTSMAFLFLGGLTAVALTVLIRLGFGVPFPASWPSYAAIVLLTLLSSLGLGFLVAAVSKTDSQAVQLSMLLLLAGIFFSGMFLPLARIGMPALAVSLSLPATWAFLGFQQLMLLASQPDALVLIVLLGMSVGLLGLATFVLSRRARK